jgi:hypothetical protein
VKEVDGSWGVVVKGRGEKREREKGRRGKRSREGKG